MKKEEMFIEENRVLLYTLKAVENKKKRLSITKEDYRQKGLAQQEYYWETRMDDAEKIQARSMYDEMVDEFLLVLKDIYKCDKMLNSPYYGRIVFKDKSDRKGNIFYIGLFGFKESDSPFILDWRTPLAGLFYDSEVGEVQYETVDEVVKGDLLDKRQLKIEGGELKYCINSSVKIDDDILQQALARHTTDKMQNVVATIQKEQNKIIRLPYNCNVIVQGVAGSGKTSIALHRVAFLLYRDKEFLSNRNVAILSPNKVFEDYISTVLPELGEENIKSVSFDKILEDYFYVIDEKVETKAEQYERLLIENKLSKESTYKGSPQFLKDLREFLLSKGEKIFNAKEIISSGFEVSLEEVKKIYFKDNKGREHKDKISAITKYVKNKYMLSPTYSEVALTGFINNKIKSMTPAGASIMLYRDFLKSKGFEFTRIDHKIKYEDSFAIMVIDDFLKGLVPETQINHLIIDEMQDYTATQYHVLNKLYKCPKTILGDWGQSVDVYSAKKTIDYLPEMYENSIFLKINKCYRSGAEIGKLCNSIGRREDVILIRRTGEYPNIKRVDGIEEFMNEVDYIYEKCQNKAHKNIAIITKNRKEAQFYYDQLKDRMAVSLITTSSQTLPSGVVIIPSFQSKGLEFDCVIVPDACDDNYKSTIEQQNLYVATSRALHSLNIFYSDEPSRYLTEYMKEE